MLKSKKTTVICTSIVVITLIITLLFINGKRLGVEEVHANLPYEDSLFSTDKVHNIDIVVDEADFNEMLENAMDEEYVTCNVVIDGNVVKNVAIRTKGNSSLSTMANSDSDRYSFKIEFDHYEDGNTYLGLDKLALNNIIQDNTYLKDYMSYQMMNYFEVDSPLSSFIWITVNGEDWGLYLAVEAIEDSFIDRTYSNTDGELYKPDSMNMGGGGDNKAPKNMPAPENIPEGMEVPEDIKEMLEKAPENLNDVQEEVGQVSTEKNPEVSTDSEINLETKQLGDNREDFKKISPSGMGGGQSDVALVYTDDEFDSYSNIFDSAKTDVTDTDKVRLIESLKQLSEGENLSEVLNIEEVLRYFVVHNYLLNFDSYTGNMMHNYYLYEDSGKLSMIAWDYNLAFGAFAMGGSPSNSKVDNSTSLANYPIDTPVSGTTLEDRPMIGQLLSNEEYLTKYHELFSEFITEYFDSGVFEEEITNAISLISPYVEKDPTAFVSYSDFLEASSQLKSFCELRTESIKEQLKGEIPSTSEGQSEDSSSLIDASEINIESMGSNSFGGRGDNGENRRQPVDENIGELSEKEQQSESTNLSGKTEDSNREATFETLGGKSLKAEEVPDKENINQTERWEDRRDQKSEADNSTNVPTNPGVDTSQRANEDKISERRGQMEDGVKNLDVQSKNEEFYIVGASLLVLVLGIVVVKKYKVHR
ncbi:CotH protein [Anaerosphaera aminiphila DSM 21120]|uniref:CotH protein n=1 Tax=Anaerosphaera aminiphila DSM 21120 TaxID=1120995 RepID=A0A1M5STQ3_9FIRM|nr:CotH kinase family protein [Anaerosphaera aminiphila]SHH41884.1 CotH protein [Anaerosphaera aminiphila DSM 21120]